MSDTKPSSWRRGKGLASWWFRTCETRAGGELPDCPAGAAALSAWLAERVRRVMHALAPFATLQRLVVDTGSGGESTRVLTGAPATILRDYERFAAGAPDVLAARLTLALHCVDADARPFCIEGGAHVVLELPLDAEGRLIEQGEGIDLRLTLDTDIHSPHNPCPEPDNRRLAALNGPRLAAFIERLEAAVPCRFEMASGDEYFELLSRRGFEFEVPA